jgi:tetratricopeptide (TPR) repeat protein
LLHETGKIKEAQEQYIAALRRNPNDYNLMFKLGELFFTELKDRNNARRYFERVIELAPNMWQAHLNLGVISIQENNVGAAIEEHFLTADRLSPRNLRILHLLAAAYERNNDRENALRTYERVLELNPLDDIALYKRRLLRQ